MKSSVNTMANAKSVNRREVVADMRGVGMWFDNPSHSLRDASLEVRCGEVFGLLGPKGSWKSTVIKILAGRLSPTAGKVKVQGRSLLHRVRRSGIGYLPEITAENRQVNLARVLVKNPELVILDEPFSTLGEESRREMKELILSLARRGKTVVLSSNSLADVKEICDRMAILFDGKIQAIGTLDELLAKSDAVRFLAPLLPGATAERLLKIIREYFESSEIAETVTKSIERTMPKLSAEETVTERVLGSFTKTSTAKPSEDLTKANAAVNHEKLAKLTKRSN